MTKLSLPQIMKSCSMFGRSGDLFPEVGGEVLVLKSKCAARVSFTVWGKGARLRALVGSRGKAPEALGFYSIFNAKYCLILTHSSYKLEKKG